MVTWLVEEQTRWKRWKRQAVEKLLNDIQPRTDRTLYPPYRARGWQIGSGMIESTAKQLVGLRLKGPGMHRSEAGAMALTSLRATDLNDQWHKAWTILILNA